jgi:SIR2-like domain
MEAIKPIPAPPKGLREAALKGTLIPFIGAGASKIAGCPNWSEFADGALRFFVEQAKFSHGQLAQISHLHPRVKLSIALGLQAESKIPIDFRKVLYPTGGRDSAKGRRLYETLSKLGKTFVTTNYDEWLDTAIGAPAPSVRADPNPATSAIEERRTVIYEINELTPDNLRRPNTVFHIHGSVLKPESMILTTQHYVRHYANDRLLRGTTTTAENNVLTFLDFLFTQKNVLFVGYGLDELEILEYVIGKARLNGEPGRTEMRHFLLQGFFSHEQEVARSLVPYYRECGIELIPFLRDNLDWDQLIDVLEEFARLAPVGDPLKVQTLKEMEALLE